MIFYATRSHCAKVWIPRKRFWQWLGSRDGHKSGQELRILFVPTVQRHSDCSSSVALVGVAVVAKCDMAKVIIHNESAAGVQEGGRTGQWSQPNRPNFCSCTVEIIKT